VHYSTYSTRLRRHRLTTTSKQASNIKLAFDAQYKIVILISLIHLLSGLGISLENVGLENKFADSISIRSTVTTLFVPELCKAW